MNIQTQFPRLHRALRLALLFSALSVPVAARELHVAATSKPIHSLVAAVMGDRGSLSLIIDGSVSPHTFTLKPSGARALHDADIVFRVSEMLEPFSRKIARSLPETVTLVSLAEAPGIRHLAMRASGTFEAHHHDHDGFGEGEAAHSLDPHVWLDPVNAKAMADEIARALSAADATQAARYTENAAALKEKIDELDSELRAALVPVAKRPFVIFHDATQYFEDHFGLAAAGSITVSPEVQPSAKRLTEVRRRIKALGAVCVFSEPLFQPNLMAAVTEGTDARAATLDPEGVMLTAGPDLYFALMRGLTQSLVDCLSGG